MKIDETLSFVATVFLLFALTIKTFVVTIGGISIEVNSLEYESVPIFFSIKPLIVAKITVILFILLTIVKTVKKQSYKVRIGEFLVTTGITIFITAALGVKYERFSQVSMPGITLLSLIAIFAGSIIKRIKQ